MKLINWIFGVFIILLGIIAYEFSIVAMLLLITAGLLGLPPVAKIIDTKFKTNRSTRNVVVAILILTALYLIGLTAE